MPSLLMEMTMGAYKIQSNSRSEAMDIRVTMFEDNKLFRTAMQAVLNNTAGYTCSGAFENSHDLLENISFTRPDVILMDIEMPGMSGIEATVMIRKHFPLSRVLIQTVFDDSDKIFQAMCAGASGYILKNEQPRKYLESIAEVFNGGCPMSAAVARKVFGFFSNKNVILVAPAEEDYHLTAREKELLALMIDGDDYKTISEKNFISYETVRTHVRNIYQKLHVTCRNEAVMKAIQQGLI